MSSPSRSTTSSSEEPTQSIPSSANSKVSPSKTNTNNSLVTDHGKTAISSSVVAKIAGIAAREIAGIHDLGKSGERTMGTIKSYLPNSLSTTSTTQGVDVEVGERQAAIDVDLVCDYGVSLVDLAQAVRQNIIQRVETMTGLEVTEVNVGIDDIYLGDDSGSDSSNQ